MSRCCSPAIPLTCIGLIYGSEFLANERGLNQQPSRGRQQAGEVSPAHRFPAAAWQLTLVLGENGAKGRAAFFGVDGAGRLERSGRDMTGGHEQISMLSEAQGRWIPSIGENIYSNGNNCGQENFNYSSLPSKFYQRETNSAADRQPGVCPSALFSWEYGKVLEKQVLFQSLNPQTSQVQYLQCQTS